MRQNNIYLHQFKSLYEFVEYVKTAKTNKAFECHSKTYELATEVSRPTFFGTSSMEEAQDLMSNGYMDGMKALIKGEGSVKLPASPRNQRRVDVVGGQAHVANAIIGLPKTMIRTIKQPRKTPAITLYYDMGANCDISKETLEKGGKNAMTLVQYLERNGIRVCFKSMIATCKIDSNNDRIIGIMTVNIKNHTQQINPLLMSYAITHPSFFRRHGFRWIETSWATDRKEFGRNNNYGTAFRTFVERIDGKTMAQVLKKKDNKNGLSVLQPNDFYLDCETSASATCIADLIKAIDLNIKSL